MKSGEWKYLHEWYDHYKPDVVISFVDETLINLRAQRKKIPDTAVSYLPTQDLFRLSGLKGKHLKTYKKTPDPFDLLPVEWIRSLWDRLKAELKHSPSAFRLPPSAF